MYVGEGRYGEWFFGRLGEVIKMSTPNQIVSQPNRYTNWDGATVPDGAALTQKVRSGSCRVKWLEPVPYFDRKAYVSDFSQVCFECVKR